MRSQNTGYGISGAFNVYSSRAKLGNWVEDEAGIALASAPRPAKGIYITDSREKHCDPKLMTAHPSMTSIKMLSTAELKAKNKEGTSYSLLFDHGKEMTPTERYSTTHKEKFGRSDSAIFELLARQQGDLARSKEKQTVREIKSLYNHQPINRLQNAHVSREVRGGPKHFTPYVLDKGPVEPLPVWRRNTSFSEQ